MDQEYLEELRTYSFPEDNLDDLTVQRYTELSKDLSFLVGYNEPSPEQRAKVYVALYELEQQGHELLAFTTKHGLIIKAKTVNDDLKSSLQCLSETTYVGLIESFSKEKEQAHLYFLRLFLDNFDVQCRIMFHREPSGTLIFVFSEDPLPEGLSDNWKHYRLKGTVPLLQVVPEDLLLDFNEHYPCTFVKDGTVEVHQTHKLNINWKALNPSPTFRLETGPVNELITAALQNVGVRFFPCGDYCLVDQPLRNPTVSSDFPTEGCEIFTQIAFSDMSAWEKAGCELYQGHWMLSSALTNYLVDRKSNPITRVEIEENELEYWKERKKIYGTAKEDHPELKITTTADTTFFLLQTDCQLTLFLELEHQNDMDDSDEDDPNDVDRLTLLLVSLWSTGNLFRAPNHWPDHPLAVFRDEVLGIILPRRAKRVPSTEIGELITLFSAFL